MQLFEICDITKIGIFGGKNLKNPKRAVYRAQDYTPPTTNRFTPNKFSIRGMLATISMATLLFGFVYEGVRWREVDVEIANVMEAVARRSNPCYSYQKLQVTADFIKKKGLDTGNTAIIPDSPLYPSEGENYSVDNWFDQVQDSISLYKGLCSQLIEIEPKIAEYEEDEKKGEEKYRNLKDSNPKLNLQILTADFATSSDEIDDKLVGEKGKAVIPDGLHLMPNLRLFLFLRWLSYSILLLCYIGPVLGFLSNKKTFKFGFNLLSYLAPWRLK